MAKPDDTRRIFDTRDELFIDTSKPQEAIRKLTQIASGLAERNKAQAVEIDELKELVRHKDHKIADLYSNLGWHMGALSTCQAEAQETYERLRKAAGYEETAHHTLDELIKKLERYKYHSSTKETTNESSNGQ